MLPCRPRILFTTEVFYRVVGRSIIFPIDIGRYPMLSAIVSKLSPIWLSSLNFRLPRLPFCDRNIWRLLGHNFPNITCISLYLHRALNKVTQSANQHMHTFNFLFIKTFLKFLKTLLHVSVIRPSSRSLYFLAKITLINITFDIPILKNIITVSVLVWLRS